MKRTIALMLAAVALCAVILSGCGNGGEESAQQSGSTASEGSGTATVAGDNPYSNLDTSEEAKIVMYAVATEPNDMDEVLLLANERIKSVLNATLDLYFITDSEFSVTYPLVLAGGDQVDLIYTANFRDYRSNVEKSSFLELTPEFLQTNMPQTWATLPQAAWEETYVDGKIYMVPRNTSSIFPDRGPFVNMDIAEKYGYTADKITSYDDFKNLLLAIGDNEASNGMYAYYQSPTSNFEELGWRYRFNLINNQASDYVFYCQLDDPKFENPFFLYTSDYWQTYIQEMAELAEAGCWPSDAISNTNSIITLFENGQSATSRGNFYNGITMIEGYREKGMNVELFDIFPEGYRALRDSYLGDGYAIPVFSENAERAAQVLDYIKCDKETNFLLAGGVEGRHYIYDEATNTVSPGPEAADYEFDGWAWGIRHKDFPWPKTDDARINAANEHLKDTQIKDDEWPYWGFQFSPTPVMTEWTVISELITEYQPSFDLGMYGDNTMEEYQNFVNQLNDAGLEKYMAEWNRQRDEFLANKN